MLNENENIDSLQIDISSQSDSAVSSLDALLSSLKKLDKIGKSTGLAEVRKQLKGIAGIKFDNLSNQLGAVTAYIQQLSKAQKQLGSLTFTARVVDTESVTRPIDDMVEEVNRGSEAIREIDESFGETDVSADWVETVRSECQAMIDGFSESSDEVKSAHDRLRSMLGEKHELYGDDSRFKSASAFDAGIDDSLRKANLSAELLEDTFTRLSSQSGEPDKKRWYDLEKAIIAVKQQYQSLLTQTNKNADAVNSLGNESKKTTGKLGKMLSRLKRVALYRMARFILSQITRSVTEGLQNIAKFNDSANNIMSEYKTEFTYMKNSLGSAVIPMLQALLPIVIRIGDAFVDITNSIGMISAALNGNDTFIKAKKYVQDYAEAVEDAKRATLGIDEINILGKQENDNSDVSQMFEEVDLTGGDVAGAIAKIAGLVASITTLLVIFKGAKMKEFFVKMGTGLKTSFNALKNMSVWKKGALSIAALALEAVAVYNIFRDLTLGTTSVGNALLALIPILAIVGIAMYAMWGPVGLVVAAVVALVAAIAGVASAQIELKKEAAMAEFFAVEGEAIEKVTEKMDLYFKSIGIDKQQEMNEKLFNANEELADAIFYYDTLWDTIKKADKLDSTQIEELGKAFNDLADAAINLNNASIGVVMSNIRTGIMLNITPELTEELDGLLASLQAAQDILGVKIKGIKAEYQKVLDEIASSGGKITSAQKATLEKLRGDINKFTLTDNTSAKAWEGSVQTAINKGIKAGEDKESIQEALNELTKKRDSYLDTLKTSYYSSVSVLEQLIKVDKEEFGGALGFSDKDLTTLAKSFNAQIDTVNEQFNSVITAIANNLANNALDYDAYHAGWLGDIFASIGAGAAGLIDWIWTDEGGWDFLADRAASADQKELIEWIRKQLKDISAEKVEVPKYATGGFPEDGLFRANRGELVGQFANGRTAVANNEQIIEGIKQGVSEALSEQGGQGGDWTIQIIDENGRVKGETIITATERKNRRDGKTIISVGV